MSNQLHTINNLDKANENVRIHQMKQLTPGETWFCSDWCTYPV